MASIQLASFPNSRIKPRPSRTQGDTEIITINPGPAQVAVPANLNRTDLNLRNLDSAITMYVGYDASIDDQVGPNGAMPVRPNEVVSLTDPRDIYIFIPGAVALNVAVDQGEG